MEVPYYDFDITDLKLGTTVTMRRRSIVSALYRGLRSLHFGAKVFSQLRHSGTDREGADIEVEQRTLDGDVIQITYLRIHEGGSYTRSIWI